MNLLQGASGYFSRPQVILDPSLFEGDQLHPHVRDELLGMFYQYMATQFKGTEDWTMLWLAGSGISYQWSGNRGNGDLDVLFGIDYSKFVTDNPEYRHYERYEIAEAMDSLLKSRLWPKTAHTTFGDTTYEVTYYLNPGVEDYDKSITFIHPYAAYNLTEDHWTVESMKPEEFDKGVPEEFENQASANRYTADQLATRYKYLKQQLGSVHPGTPQSVNLEASKKLVVQNIRNMFDSIHLGRKNAFSSQGEGYGDFYNFQWQAAKRDGIVSTFNEILNQEN